MNTRTITVRESAKTWLNSDRKRMPSFDVTLDGMIWVTVCHREHAEQIAARLRTDVISWGERIGL